MKRVALSAVVVAVTAAGVVAAPERDARVGRQPDGSVLTPTNQQLRPAGRQAPLTGRPAAVAVRPTGGTVAVLSTTGPVVTVLDVRSGRVVSRAATADSGSARGIAYSPDGRFLYASVARPARLLQFPVGPTGLLGRPAALPVPKAGKLLDVPTGLAVSPRGRRLYVALNRGNRLGIYDTASRRLLATVGTGNAPNDVALSGETAVVVNGGGRRARGGDTTNLSAGTPIVTRPGGARAASGTVSLVDLRSNRLRANVFVGLQPAAVVTRGQYAFVANADSDTVSVVDVPRATTVTTISVRPFPAARFGSSPSGIRTLGADRLLVTLARNNALAVYRWTGPTQPAVFEGLLPTGWYPADVAVSNRLREVVIVNRRGAGPVPDANPAVPRPYTKKTEGKGALTGTVSFLGWPSRAELAAGVRTVAANNAWDVARASAAPPRRVAPVAVPERVGEPSLIKHVFYVIKENRTYDQVLGDDPRGNGDPRLVHFGAAVTPNQHRLAVEFPLFDNFYVSGTLSADAHQWATQAFVNDYAERQYGAFPRSYAYDGGDALSYAPSGFLWENAQRHGRSVRVYGEFANRKLSAAKKQTASDIPSLDRVLSRRYPPFDMTISDSKRVDILLGELDRMVKSGTVPNLTIIQLPLDHTNGTKPGAMTPESDVADNDAAFGRFVSWLTHSKIWPTSAVFAFEDDAQNGLDHVDGHRTAAFVVSPYARRGVVDSGYYTQINLIRTIEQILGLPPMNQMDAAATPMREVFTNTPDLRPFDAIPRLVPATRNPPLSALRGIAKEWALACAKMDFTIPDAAPEQLLNRAIWYSVRGFVPYPGDGRVLRPSEVAARYGVGGED
ncbi:MAG TPA: bifunctional YncE family protein/alkaline phosphatase family protein [Frankiaceae bacterium]|nr:bifunctional YncE family protein/alkaline phosphatase family protein [Frankiaceae bacterium]